MCRSKNTGALILSGWNIRKKKLRLNACISVLGLFKVYTGKYDLAVVTEYPAEKRASGIRQEYGITCARVLDLLGSIKRYTFEPPSSSIVLSSRFPW